MKVQRINIINAFFLLVVFSLNTIIGFACSIGINLGYNSSHHQQGSCHSSQKVHAQKSAHKPAQDAAHKKIHQQKHKEANRTSKNTQNDCCANDVTRFIQLDKSVVKTNFDFQVPAFLVAYSSVFFRPLPNQNIFANNLGLLSLQRSCSTYDTDIRIAIQSFQI